MTCGTSHHAVGRRTAHSCFGIFARNSAAELFSIGFGSIYAYTEAVHSNATRYEDNDVVVSIMILWESQCLGNKGSHDPYRFDDLKVTKDDDFNEKNEDMTNSLKGK